MATDFGLDNGGTPDRHIQMPLRAEWTITEPNVTIVSKVQVADDSGSFYGYYYSTGGFGASNSMNCYHGEQSNVESNRWLHRFNSRNAPLIQLTDVGDSVWRLIVHYFNVSSGRWRIGYIDIDDNTFNSEQGPSGTTQSNTPTTVLFGCRADFQTDRYYKNRIAWHAHWNTELTEQQLIDMANGQSPFVTQNANLQILMDFTDHNAIQEVLSGDTPLVKSGTGYANVPQPYPTLPVVTTENPYRMII